MRMVLIAALFAVPLTGFGMPAFAQGAATIGPGAVENCEAALLARLAAEEPGVTDVILGPALSVLSMAGTEIGGVPVTLALSGVSQVRRGGVGGDLVWATCLQNGVTNVLAFVVPLGREQVPAFVRYSCAGRVESTTFTPDGPGFRVGYINDGPSHMAILPLVEGPRLFANVVAASGARYAAGFYIWWTRGDEAGLYDIRAGEDAPAVLTCTSVRPAAPAVEEDPD